MTSYERLHIIIRGVVQGVGYRYFAVHAARSLDVTGWTRNRSDGSVEITAEGTTGALHEFVAELRRGPTSASVRDVQVTPGAYQADFERFEVRH